MASRLHIALFAGLLFYIVSNPITYTIVDSVWSKFGIPIAYNGKPTGFGLLGHSAVFSAVIFLLLKL